MKDGWAVLVASLFLRKTTVAQVAETCEKLLRKFPSPQSLLSAGESEVVELIRPLGIHQRARQLRGLAKVLVEHFGGRVPCSREELKKLPGIRDHIAAEVLLRVCGQPEPLLDRNMIRVIERVFGVKSARKRPHTDPELCLLLEGLCPKTLKKQKSSTSVCWTLREKCVELEVRVALNALLRTLSALARKCEVKLLTEHRTCLKNYKDYKTSGAEIVFGA